MKDSIILGIDLGTSGVRATIVKRLFQNHNPTLFSPIKNDQILVQQEIKTANNELLCDSDWIDSPRSAKVQSAESWIGSLEKLLDKLGNHFDLQQVDKIIVDATSSTVLLNEEQTGEHTAALMYNDSQAVNAAELINKTLSGMRSIPQTAATGTSSTLAKVLWLYQKWRLEKNLSNSRVTIYHQADWINHYFCSTLNTTDMNNALKLGYDPVNEEWPDWVIQLLNQQAPAIDLPKVIQPGTLLATIRTETARKFGFRSDVRCYSGTTDSIAGFLASGAQEKGDAVTSQGSTLAIKQLADRPVFNRDQGLYSHKVKNIWLIGGASNSGGKVLLEHFSLKTLKNLLQLIEYININDTCDITGFGEHSFRKLFNELKEILESSQQTLPECFYPLSRHGERFPIQDANLEPRMPVTPKKNWLPEKDTRLEHLLYELSHPGDYFTTLDDEFVETVIEYCRFLMQLIQGITYIEQLAYTKLAAQTGIYPNHLYSVGGGTQNRLWQNLRNRFIPGDSAKAFSGDASYGVTRLIND